MEKRRILSGMLCVGLLCVQASRGVSQRAAPPPLQVVVATNGDGSNLTLSVVNVSNTYQIFESITCSWQNVWQTNDPTARVMGPQACARNFRYVIVLAPGQKHTEPVGSVLFRGKPGKRTIRFGYSRRISNFSNAELQQIFNSAARTSYFSQASVASRFTGGMQMFWSAPIRLSAPLSSLLH